MTDDELAWLSAAAERRDQIELALSDSLDVKANIWLAVVTFLAAVDGALLLPPLGGVWFRAFQIAALALVAASGLRTLGALFPLPYDFAPLPDELARWLEQAREYFGPGPGGLAYLRREATEATIRRLVANRRKNLRKSRCIVIGYWVLLPALPIILFSLGWLAHELP